VKNALLKQDKLALTGGTWFEPGGGDRLTTGLGKTGLSNQ